MRIFCDSRCIFPNPAGGRGGGGNTSNEQNVRSYFMLNHRIRGLLFHHKKKMLFCNWLLFFLVRVFRNILIPSLRMTLTMSKMFASIICQSIEWKVNYSTAKNVILASIFYLIFVSRFVQFSHSCSLCIRRYSPCCKPVQPGHYTILRVLLTLYGKTRSNQGLMKCVRNC